MTDESQNLVSKMNFTDVEQNAIKLSQTVDFTIVKQEFRLKAFELVSLSSCVFVDIV